MTRYNFNEPVNARLSNIELKLKQHTHDVASLRQSGATNGQVLTWNSTNSRWEAAAPTGGSAFVGNLDGGEPDTNFGGISPIDLGGV